MAYGPTGGLGPTPHWNGMERQRKQTEMTNLQNTLFSGDFRKVRRSLTMTFLIYKFNPNSVSANLKQIPQTAVKKNMRQSHSTTATTFTVIHLINLYETVHLWQENLRLGAAMKHNQEIIASFDCRPFEVTKW